MAQPTPAADELDPGLIERARHDRAALERLLGRIEPRVRRWALVSLADPDAAADVTQRVLLRVSRGLDEFRGESRFASWLYRVTANAAVDEHRRQRRSRGLREAMLEHAPVEAERAPTDDDPAARLDALTVRRLVGRFAEELPERQRQVFDLVDLQGCEPVEAAEMLGIAPPTARVHLLRARRALRSALIEHSPEIHEEYG